MFITNILVFSLFSLNLTLLLLLLCAPPISPRRPLLTSKALTTSRFILWSKHAIHIAMIGVGVLFVDACVTGWTTWKMVQNGDESLLQKAQLPVGGLSGRLLLTERNVYLYGVTLLISFLLSRVHSLVLEIAHKELSHERVLNKLIYLEAQMAEIAEGGGPEKGVQETRGRTAPLMQI